MNGASLWPGNGGFATLKWLGMQRRIISLNSLSDMMLREVLTMPTQVKSELAQRAEAVYEQRLKAKLEAEHRGMYVVIEPDSGEYFLGRTLSEAIWAGYKAYPDRETYALRIGWPVAVELGNSPL
jgi:hypothetical protein